ncbi:ubiquinone biosynthesis O-methyltransferase, mitochondrial-like isoform X2 [Chironomus tepperi]|uniref:ubiquinone biosynthesis O-methyltransferase, mitochondrial-like isoform X2 n=1 Tax=Chironomus tepperi TaxID=113505 RepID=UPI00391F27D8
MEKPISTATNVDVDNVKLLETSAAEWWDPSGIQTAIHSLNPCRIALIIDGLISTGKIKAEDRNKPDVLKGIDILDVGCGAGILTEALARLKANVVGLDPSEELVKIARDHMKGQSLNIEYITEFIEDYSIKNPEKYDAVVASEVVEHVPDQKSFLLGMAKCVKPNGSLFITTPNRTMFSYVGTKIAYMLKVIVKDSHTWSHFITPSEVAVILKEQNCNTILVRGLWFTPFFNTFCFAPYQGMQYALHAVKYDNQKQK